MIAAAYYGEEDICRELFKHIPAATRSSLPTKPENAMVEELCYEGELTALHLASYSGSENVVRAVLNQPKVETGIIKKTLPPDIMYCHTLRWRWRPGATLAATRRCTWPA